MAAVGDPGALRAEAEAPGTSAARQLELAAVALRGAGRGDRRLLHVAYALACREDLSPALAEALARTDEGLVLGALVSNPRAPDRILREHGPGHRWRLGLNPALPRRLAADHELIDMATLRALAATSARAELLEALAGIDAPALREALARNPACPELLLVRLIAGDDPRAAEEARRHPSAPSQLAFADLEAAADRSAAGAPRGALVEAAAERVDGQVEQVARALEVLLDNPALTPADTEVIAALARRLAARDGDATRRLAAKLLDHPRAPLDLLVAAVRREGVAGLRRPGAAAAGPELIAALDPESARELAAAVDDPQWIAAFAEHGDAAAREALASNPRLEADVILRLAADPVVAVAEAALRRTARPPGIVAAALRGGPVIRSRVPMIRDLPLTPAELAALVEDPAAVVRVRVAVRPELDDAALLRLAGDPSEAVRVAIASRPQLPEAALLRLCAEPSPTVAQAICERRELPRAAVERLLVSARVDLRCRLLARPDCPPALLFAGATDLAVAVREVVAGHPAAPAEALATLAADRDVAVQRALLRQRRLPPAAWLRLAEGGDHRVLDALVDHPRASPRALACVANRVGLGAAGRAFRHRRLEPAARELFAAVVAADTELGPLSLAYVRGGLLRRLAALHPRCPPEVLASIVEQGDSDAPLREIAASHPRCPPAAIDRAATDRERRVREAAAHRRACAQTIAELQSGASPALVGRRVDELLGDPYWRRDAHRRAVARALLASSGLAAGSRRRLEEAFAAGAPDPASPIYVYAALEGWLAVREGFDREDRREAEHDYAALVRRSFRGGLSLDFSGDSIRALLRDPQAALGALQVFGGGLGYGLRARVGLHRAPSAAGERAFDVARFLANHGHAGLAVADAETAAGFATIARVDPYLPLTRGGWTEAIETAALVFGPTSPAGGL